MLVLAHGPRWCRSILTTKVTESRLMVAEHVIHWALNLLLILLSALAKLVQVKLILLLVSWFHVFRVVRTCSPFVSISVLGSIRQAVCRLRSYLHFSTG